MMLPSDEKRVKKGSLVRSSREGCEAVEEGWREAVASQSVDPSEEVIVSRPSLEKTSDVPRSVVPPPSDTNTCPSSRMQQKLPCLIVHAPPCNLTASPLFMLNCPPSNLSFSLSPLSIPINQLASPSTNSSCTTQLIVRPLAWYCLKNDVGGALRWIARVSPVKTGESMRTLWRTVKFLTLETAIP
jgi:hypothetical protein